MPAFGAIGVVLAIILFVVAHEAGHYFAAKATGMKVTEFFIGFGPKIWSFRRGETEYGIKPIPFGAYVKIVGMSSLEEVDPADAGRTYREKEFWKKTVVVLAGVATNFLLAYLIFFGIALADGEAIPNTEVAAVVEELEGGGPTAAAAAGLMEGDIILAVDGIEATSWETVAERLAGLPNQDVVLAIDRGGDRIELPVTLGERVDPETGETIGFLGVAPGFDRVPISIFSAAGLAGRQLGTGIGYTFVTFGEIFRLESLAQIFGGLFGGEVPDEVRPVSPIGLAQIGAQVGDLGVRNLIFLLAVVNVVLATINALPLFPLDGGHFAVALYEKLSGRQADVRKLMPLAILVIGMLSLLGVAAIILDIIDPIDI